MDHHFLQTRLRHPSRFSSCRAIYLDFQWKKGMNNIAGATDPQYIAKNSGSYKLVVTYACGNTATSNAISVTANPALQLIFTQGLAITILFCLTRTGTPTSGVTDCQWKKGNTNIPGATNNTFSATQTAKYKVIVTITATGVRRLSPSHMVTINCKEGLEKVSSITAYPNPSSNFFTIHTAGLQDGYVDVYDLTEKLLEHALITSETTKRSRKTLLREFLYGQGAGRWRIRTNN
jgi:hypothetical protein